MEGFRIGGAWVEVNPELADDFREQIEAKAGDTRVKARVDLDDGDFKAQVDEDTARLRALGEETARPKVDSSGVQQGGRWMGLLVSAATMVAPAMVAAGVGVGAFGALAIPTLDKVLRYEHDLHANTAKAAKDWQGLDATQRQMAGSITALGTEYRSLAADVRPQVVDDFNIAIGEAGRILPELTGAAQGGGRAVGGLLAQFGGFLQGGAARQFFSFVQQEAAPDMHALGNTLTGATSGAMGLSQALNPMATGLLNAAGGAATLVGDLSRADPLLVQITAGTIGAGFAAQKLVTGWQALAGSAVGGKVISVLTGAPAALRSFTAEATAGSLVLPEFAGEIGVTTAALEGLSASEKAAMVSTAALDAISPLGWVAIATAATGGLVYALRSTHSAASEVASDFQRQDTAAAGSVQAYRALAAQMGQTAAASKDVFAQLAARAGEQQASQQAQNLTENLNKLELAYGVSRGQALQLAGGVQGATTAFARGGTAARDMLVQVEGYAAEGAQAASASTQLAINLADVSDAALPLDQRVKALTSDLGAMVSPLVSVVQGTVQLGNDNSQLAQALKKSGDMTGYHTQAQRNASLAMSQSVADTLSLSDATLANTGSASKARGVLQEEIDVLEKLGAKGAVAAGLLRSLQHAEDALHSKAITISVREQGGFGGTAASGGSGGMLRAGLGQGMAAGGVVPGYAPGRDTVGPLWVSPGEGWIVPEAVRGLGGPQAIEAINRHFGGARVARDSRPGHFAAGGVAEFSASTLAMQDNFRITVSAPSLSPVSPVAPLPHGTSAASSSAAARHQAALAAAAEKRAAARLKSMETAGRRIAEAFADGSLKTIAQIRTERNTTLNTLEKYYAEKRIHPLVEAITRQTGQLQALTAQSGRISAEIRNMKQFASQETSSLASWSGLGSFSPVVTGETTKALAGNIQTQVAAKLATLKQFYALLGRMKTAKVSRALIAQAEQLGPDAGVQYMQAILSGGKAYISELNSEESQIGSLETKTGQRAADIQFGQPVGRAFLASLKAQRAAIDAEMRRAGDTLAREVARALHVPLSEVAGLPRNAPRHPAHHQPHRGGNVTINLHGGAAAERRQLRRELAKLL